MPSKLSMVRFLMQSHMQMQMHHIPRILAELLLNDIWSGDGYLGRALGVPGVVPPTLHSGKDSSDDA